MHAQHAGRTQCSDLREKSKGAARTAAASTRGFQHKGRRTHVKGENDKKAIGPVRPRRRNRHQLPPGA